MQKTPLFEIPVPSTTFRADVELHDAGTAVSIVFQYTQDGSQRCSRLVFEKVRAYRHRAELHCTAWHIDGVYDVVAEVGHSEWAEEIKGDTPTDRQDQWVLRHFMLYLDSAECYEFLADNWRFHE